MNQKIVIRPAEAQRSAYGGRLGAWPHENGVAFGVWAPNAEAVSVIGSFNDWRADAHPLERDEAGCWWGEIAEASTGDEYRYHIRYRGESFDKIDPRARRVTHSQGNAVVYDSRFDWEGDDFTPAPLSELVFYEMHIGTFNGQDDKPGTFDTAIERLGHLRELGVNAIQLMPVIEFPGERSWGYEVSHPYAVESAYGGPDAFKRFVKAAHREGLAVFQDVIYNHFGPGDLHLWRFDGWYENDRGGIYFYQDDRADTPWGSRPDYGRREVRDYILDNALMWIEEYHVDGLRVDGTYFTRTSGKHEAQKAPRLEEGWILLCELTDRVRERFPKAILVAEDMRGEEIMTKPTAQAGAGFHTQWSDRFGHGLRYYAADAEGQREAQRNVEKALGIRFNDDPFQRIIYTESHDNAGKGERILTAADPNDPEGPMARRWLALATICVFTAPGIPLLFQGQELLTPERFDLENAEALDWSRVEKNAGVLRLHRDLIGLRRNLSGTTKGLTGPHMNIVHNDPESRILAWHRWDQGGTGDDVLVVANFSGERRDGYVIGAPAIGRWRARFNSEWEGYGEGIGTVHVSEVVAEPPGHDDMPARMAVSVGPWGSLILSLG